MSDHTTKAWVDKDDLAAKVQSLPAELYNEIYQLTFSTANFGKTCRIDEDYKPPSILQVNYKWRSTLSPTFYEDTLFTFAYPGRTWQDNLDALYRFCYALTYMQCIQVLTRGFRIVCTMQLSPFLEWPEENEKAVGREFKFRHLQHHDLLAVRNFADRATRIVRAALLSKWSVHRHFKSALCDEGVEFVLSA